MMTDDHNGNKQWGHLYEPQPDDGPLIARIKQAIAEHGGGLGTWTVLTKENDPFRADTPPFREAGEWFYDHWVRLGRRYDLHFRGYPLCAAGRAEAERRVVRERGQRLEMDSGRCRRRRPLAGPRPVRGDPGRAQRATDPTQRQTRRGPAVRGARLG
jgi:hypothetical protein